MTHRDSDVVLAARRMRLNAVLGENGAGKSSLRGATPNRRTHAAGLAVVMVSSEIEIFAIADRILAMNEGLRRAEYHRAEANKESVMRTALPRVHNAGTRLANLR
jgi:ABC-type sugar transport system ATPase subunit